MDQRTLGLLLRLHPFSETSLVVRWLTPESGRIATLARGARRPKSPLRGRLDLFYEADLTYVPSRRSTLHTLKEVVLRESFPGLRRDYAALQQAAYAAHLIERATETDTPLPDLYPLYRGFLQHCAAAAPAPAPLLGFEWRLLHWSGLAPAPHSAPLSPPARVLLRQLLTARWEDLSGLEAERSAWRDADHWLGQVLRDQWSLPISQRPEHWDPGHS